MAYVTENMRAASRENGKLGGRPKGTTRAAQAAKEKRVARKRGEHGACEAVQFLRDVMHGLVAGLGPEHRIAAARDLMDRFGFPRLAQQQHFGDFPAKLFDLTAPEPPRDQPPAGDGGVSTGNGADLSTPH